MSKQDFDAPQTPGPLAPTSEASAKIVAPKSAPLSEPRKTWAAVPSAIDLGSFYIVSKEGAREFTIVSGIWDKDDADLIAEAPAMAELLRRLSDAAANSTCDSGVVDEARALLGRLPK